MEVDASMASARLLNAPSLELLTIIYPIVPIHSPCVLLIQGQPREDTAQDVQFQAPMRTPPARLGTLVS
jgi:hypothetical protein